MSKQTKPQPPAQTGRTDVPAPRSKPLTKNQVDYWKKRLLRNSFTRNGELCKVKEFCVKIQHRSRRQTFSLDTGNGEAAATKARDIYQTIVAQGWDSAEALFNPGMLVRKDDPTLGEFFAEVQATAGLSAKTFRNYASALRTIASASLGKLAADKSKYDYRGGGHKAWLEKVDAIKLAAMTPDRVQQWKIAHIRKAVNSWRAGWSAAWRRSTAKRAGPQGSAPF